MICPECEYKNDSDAEYCVNCGSKLDKKFHTSNGAEINVTKKEGMKGTTKVLIIACIILVGALCTTIGMLLYQSTSEVTGTTVNSTSTNASENPSNQPTWNFLTSYSGTDADHGNYYPINSDKQIKLIISGKPQANYEPSDLVIAVNHENMYSDVQNLNWTATEAANVKTVEFYPKLDSKYDFRVGPHNMESWKVDIYEYY